MTTYDEVAKALADLFSAALPDMSVAGAFTYTYSFADRPTRYYYTFPDSLKEFSEQMPFDMPVGPHWLAFVYDQWGIL